MLKLFRYLKSFKKQLFIGPTFKLLEAIFELIVPLVMAKIIDVGIMAGDINYILKMGGIMLLLGIFGLGFALICQYSAAKASQGFGTLVRNDLFKHVNSLSHAEIDEIGTSSLITIITNDVNQLQLGVAMMIRLAVRSPFLVFGAIGMAMILDLSLSIVFLIIAPLVALSIYIIMSRSVPFYNTIQKKLDKIALITRENLQGVRVIRAFSRQQKEKERFDTASNDLERIAIQVGKISSLLNPLTYVIINLGIVAIIWLGGAHVYDGALTQGEVIAFVNYMMQILMALIALATLVVIFSKAHACSIRVNQVFDIKASIIDEIIDPIVIKSDINTPIIEFKNVFFSYHATQEYALKDISFKIMRGQTVGIIGGTGSGKSTLINLMPRFYEPSCSLGTCGEVLINGVNVKQYPLKQLRNKFGIVPQRAVLFAGTLAENMRWRKADANFGEIEKAVRIAQASEFVQAFKNGYETKILQGGVNLSGGQKQRLTIARALVGEPELLILDDSSSALDFATDAALRKAINYETTDMTVLIISQRAATIKTADQIIVLDDGEVSGIGTHDELIADCEVYREIFFSQLSKGEGAK